MKQLRQLYKYVIIKRLSSGHCPEMKYLLRTLMFFYYDDAWRIIYILFVRSMPVCDGMVCQVMSCINEVDDDNCGLHPSVSSYHTRCTSERRLPASTGFVPLNSSCLNCSDYGVPLSSKLGSSLHFCWLHPSCWCHLVPVYSHLRPIVSSFGHRDSSTLCISSRMRCTVEWSS